VRIRGVETGGKPPQVFRRHKKCPLSSGKVPFAIVKVVQIAFIFPLPPSPLLPPVAKISGENIVGGHLQFSFQQCTSKPVPPSPFCLGSLCLWADLITCVKFITSKSHDKNLTTFSEKHRIKVRRP
jgi:hypothetical protein